MSKRVRRLALIALAALAAACEPEIGSGTYFCGPELLCPPDLACDPSTFTCERPGAVEPFSCPAGSESAEPDDETATARPLGTLGCGQQTLTGTVGCIDEGADEDLVELTIDDCNGDDPHLEARLRFPVALVPLELVLLDDAGAEVAVAEPCAQVAGMDTLCLEHRGPAGTYYLRIRAIAAADGGDCGGACRFSHYLLDLGFLLA